MYEMCIVAGSCLVLCAGLRFHSAMTCSRPTAAEILQASIPSPSPCSYFICRSILHPVPCQGSPLKRPTPLAQSGRSSQGQRRMYSLENQTARRLLIGAVHILICPRGAVAV